jgi:hypothetical protein
MGVQQSPAASGQWLTAHTYGLMAKKRGHPATLRVSLSFTMIAQTFCTVNHQFLSDGEE